MDMITQDQDSTLRRWVSYKGKRRPSKKDRDFLCEETKLNRSQFDSWWDSNVEALKREKVPTIPSNPYGFGLITNINPTLPLNVSKQAPQLHEPNDVSQFQSMEIDFDLYSPPQDIWSPIELPQQAQQETTYQFPSTYNGHSSYSSDAWSQAGSQHRSSQSTSSSILDTYGLISPQSAMRSSYGSSVWTADSASTLNSVYDPTLEDLMMEDVGCEQGQPMSIGKFNSNPSARASKFSCKSIPEEHIHFDTQQHHPTPPIPQDIPPPVPAKPEKVTYQCTVCRKPFNRKDDWRRHEESHEPQKYWICMVDRDPALNTPAGWLCVFCDTTKPNRNEIMLHLIKEHQINECTNKHVSKRRWGRKDKLKQHLQQVHHLAETSAGAWEEWRRDNTPKKWAWGCGFCGVCSFTWKGRNDHIAEHYEKQSLSAYQWCPSQVVKALLKQAYPDFNALNAWKARLPNGDKDIQWSEADANRLRRKLEFHEDLPDRIATEAHSMALKFRANFQTLPWTPADSRVTTLTAPIEYVDMNKGPWQLDSKEIVPQIKPEPAPMVFELSGASKTNFF